MKVRIKRTSIDRTDVRLENPLHIINHDMNSHVKVGDEYWVYGIRTSRYATYMYVFLERHLVEIPMELIEVLESSQVIEYEPKLESNGDITLWPSLFNEEGFLENFSEYEEKERNAFELLRAVVEGGGNGW